MQRLRRLVWKEFLELRQNPRLFGLVIVAPIIQLTMLGYAATTDVKDVPVVVADGDRSPESRKLIARFDASRNFTVVTTVTTVSEIDPWLQRGEAWIALSVVLAVFLVGALGTGVLISTIADSQQVAFQAAALIAMLPTLILSGFIFPIASMPTGLQYVTTVIPAKYFLIALRGVVLKGLDLSAVVAPVLAMCAYAAVVLGLSAVRLGRQ